jgi:hypothetical protein
MTPRASESADVRRLRIVNGWSNHRGLAAWNLWLNNEWRMFRYYERTGWPADGFKGRRGYIRCILKALVLGWTPWQLRLRRVWL